ncbi:MAG: DUF433 domain-containing protein [Verrucomicrobiota bacterium]
MNHGRPVIKGTRVPVAMILGALAVGMSRQEAAREYDLRVADILAVVAFGRARIRGG